MNKTKKGEERLVLTKEVYDAMVQVAKQSGYPMGDVSTDIFGYSKRSQLNSMVCDKSRPRKISMDKMRSFLMVCNGGGVWSAEYRYLSNLCENSVDSKAVISANGKFLGTKDPDVTLPINIELTVDELPDEDEAVEPDILDEQVSFKPQWYESVKSGIRAHGLSIKGVFTALKVTEEDVNEWRSTAMMPKSIYDELTTKYYISEKKEDAAPWMKEAWGLMKDYLKDCLWNGIQSVDISEISKIMREAEEAGNLSKCN